MDPILKVGMNNKLCIGCKIEGLRDTCKWASVCMHRPSLITNIHNNMSVFLTSYYNIPSFLSQLESMLLSGEHVNCD